MVLADWEESDSAKAKQIWLDYQGNMISPLVLARLRASILAAGESGLARRFAT